MIAPCSESASYPPSFPNRHWLALDGGTAEALAHRDLPGSRHATPEIGFAGVESAAAKPAKLEFADLAADLLRAEIKKNVYPYDYAAARLVTSC